MNAQQRSEMEQLLRGGLNDTQIARQMKMRRLTVAQTRVALGIDKVSRARHASVEDAYQAKTRPLPGGHAEWTGMRNESGCPIVHFRGQRVSAYRVAFRAWYGREPLGVVLPACDVPGCVAARCLEDEALRNRTRAQLAAVLGMDHSNPYCPSGHRYAQTVMYRTNGERECGVCRSRNPKSLAKEEVAA